MSSFTPINADGAYFTEQESNKKLDPFAVLGLHADDNQLSMTGCRYHIRKQVMPHVFERGAGGALTRGPRVPLWRHVNVVKEMLLAGSKTHFESVKAQWAGRSVQMWNPFEAPGSVEALVPLRSRFGKSSYSFPACSVLCFAFPCLRLTLGLHTVPPQYHQPDVEEVEDEYDVAQRQNQSSTAGTGTKENPFEFDDEDDNTTSATPSTPLPRPTPSTPLSRPFASYGNASSHPPSSHHRRMEPRGVYLGTWINSGLPAANSNAVYGSRDRKDRINRRISKEDNYGRVVIGGRYDHKRTACSHADINYIPKYQGMSKEQVDAAIMPLLRAATDADRNVSPTPASNRAARNRLT